MKHPPGYAKEVLKKWSTRVLQRYELQIFVLIEGYAESSIHICITIEYIAAYGCFALQMCC
jgi:hypothetical protein